MFRGYRGGPGTARQVLLVVLVLVVGTSILVRSGDRPPARTTVLEAGAASAGVALAGAGEPVITTPIAAADAGPALPTATAGEVPVAPAPSTTAGPAPAGITATTTSPATAGPTDTPIPTVTTAPVTSTSTTSTTAPTTTTTAAPVRRGPAPSPAPAAEVVPLTNADRRAAGLGPLTRSGCLDAIASGYAEQMARSAVLAHNPGAGPAVIGCRPGATWGDNVGTAAPCDTALLEERWMASPGHRRNILTAAFERVGVGAWTDTAGGCWVQVLFSS